MTSAILPEESKGPSVVGKVAVREFLSGLQQENFALETADEQAEGDTVTFTFKGVKDGQVQLSGSAVASVQNGKIVSIVYTDNPAPQALPQTGEGGILEATWLPALAGLGLLGGGWVLRRKERPV